MKSLNDPLFQKREIYGDSIMGGKLQEGDPTTKHECSLNDYGHYQCDHSPDTTCD